MEIIGTVKYNDAFSIKEGECVVFDNYGLHQMKIADFCKYDENMQVSCGEEARNFEIFMVLTSNNIMKWTEAQMYCRKEE